MEMTKLLQKLYKLSQKASLVDRKKGISAVKIILFLCVWQNLKEPKDGPTEEQARL